LSSSTIEQYKLLYGVARGLLTGDMERELVENPEGYVTVD